MNDMSLISYERKGEGWENTVHKHLKHKKKKELLRYNNSSLLNMFRRFLIGGSCGLPLKAEHLDDLWFMTT